MNPDHLPFRNGLTYDPGIHVEIEPLQPPLTEAAIWINAPLTRAARRCIPASVTEALHVYREHERRPIAILLKISPPTGWAFTQQERLICTRPEHVRLEPRDRCILLTPDRIWAHQVGRIDGILGDLVAGTMPPPPSARRPAVGPEDDLRRLGELAP